MELQSILVIDDNKYITSSLDVSLRKEGYKVMTCNSGDGALEWLKSNIVDLIVTDINMPGLNGFEVIEKVKADPRHVGTSILVLTTQVYTKEKAREMGVNGFLIKPFSTRRLLSTIKKVLSKG